MDFDTDGRSVVPVDFDGDGDLDLAMMSLQRLRLLENRSAPRSFARVSLVATGSEPLALGARVRLRADGVTHTDWVRLTEGFQSMVPLDLHFGLADAERIESLEVRWPSGREERWEDLPVDRRLTLTEGSPRALVQELPRWSAAPIATRARDAALLSARPVPASGAGDATATEPLATPGVPLVLNLWAPWCAPCTKELPELALLARRFAGRVAFAGVSVELEDLASVRARIEQHALPYEQWLADPELLAELFGEADERASLPTTFVFDATGNLRRVFRRPVEAEELGALLSSLTGSDAFLERTLERVRSLLAAGQTGQARRYLGYVLDANAELAEAHFELGNAHALEKRPDLAEASFRRATELDPTHGRAHFNLGVARIDQRRPLDAIGPLRAKLRIDGEDPRTLFALGTASAQGRDFATARTAFERLVELDPNSAEAHAFLGFVLVELGDRAAARAALQRADELAPGNPQVQAALQRL